MFKRPFEVYLLCALLLLLSIGALYGGGALILKPDGSFLQMQPWLNKIPFPDFFIPGIVLFVFNGLLPLLVVVGLLFKPNWIALNVLNIYSDKHWSWTFALYSGIITITWIIVQQLVTEYFVLQPIVALTGLVIMVLTLMPRVTKHYRL